MQAFYRRGVVCMKGNTGSHERLPCENKGGRKFTTCFYDLFKYQDKNDKELVDPNR